MAVESKFTIHRVGKRTTMEIPVLIDGPRPAPYTGSAGTGNIIGHDAGDECAPMETKKVFDTRLALYLVSLHGSTAYCQPLQSDGFAIGMEFLEPAGRWVVQSPRLLDDKTAGG
jgi:hypothetical protein